MATAAETTLNTRLRLPEWLRARLPTSDTFARTRSLLDELKLHTVCESAKCPNHWECWSKGTATFMIAGDRCTRACGFCAVATAKPFALEADEPGRVAEATRRMRLNHVVITAVARDDLPDGGAEHFRQTIEAVRALNPDVTIVHVQRADREGNAHCWGNFGVLLDGVRAAKRVIVVAEEIVEPEIIASDPNRTVIPGFMVSAVVHCPYGAHPSPVQGYHNRDNAFFRQYHEQTKTKSDSDAWLERWVYSVPDRRAYMNQLGACRVEELDVKQHAYAAQTDYGY